MHGCMKQLKRYFLVLEQRIIFFLSLYGGDILFLFTVDIAFGVNHVNLVLHGPLDWIIFFPLLV